VETKDYITPEEVKEAACTGKKSLIVDLFILVAVLFTCHWFWTPVLILFFGLVVINTRYVDNKFRKAKYPWVAFWLTMALGIIFIYLGNLAKS